MTVNDVNSREKLEKENEWYFWGLRNVQATRGNPNAYTRFLSLSKDKNWFRTAKGYLRDLKNQSANYIARGKVGKIWEHNQMNDDIFALEKMLKAWEVYQASIPKPVLGRNMTPNISEFTFEKLIKYDSSNVTGLLRKLEIEIKSLQSKVDNRKKLYDLANNNAVRFSILLDSGSGTYQGKGHVSEPFSKFHKGIAIHLAKTQSLENQLKLIKDEKQRVLLNQSLRGINHDIVKLDSFIFNPTTFMKRPAPIGVFKNVIPYYSSLNPAGFHTNRLNQLNSESIRLDSEINEYKNNQLLNKEIIFPKIIVPKIIVPKIIVPKIVPVIPAIVPATIPVIDPAVLPSIVASSSLLPLGILAILLLNSSRGKK